MSLLRFEAFLKEVMGLDTASVGSATIERAVKERAAASRLKDLEAYWQCLNASPSERQALIEAVVVPETWFFRDPGAFRALASLAATRRLSPLRVLSMPCSTGEEPYSIAMALLDASVDPARLTIDAVDISARALDAARQGVYRKNSFRSSDQAFRDRFFDGDQLDEHVRAQVCFHQGNLFALDGVLPAAAYDAIFCRNLLIYLDRKSVV